MRPFRKNRLYCKGKESTATVIVRCVFFMLFVVWHDICLKQEKWLAMKKYILFTLVLCIPLIPSCQNHRGKSKAPKWAHKLPKSNSKVFAVGKGSSGSADIAYRKAVLEANTMLAKKIGPVVTSKTSKIISTVENGKTVEKKVDVIRQKVTASLEGVEEVNRYQTREGELYIAYVLVSIPNQAISRSIVNGINSDSTLLAKLSSTKMYNDLLSEANR